MQNVSPAYLPAAPAVADSRSTSTHPITLYTHINIFFYPHPTYTFTSFQLPAAHQSVDAIYLHLSFHLAQISWSSSLHSFALSNFTIFLSTSPLHSSLMGPVSGTHHDGYEETTEGTRGINHTILNTGLHSSLLKIRKAETYSDLPDQNCHFFSINRIFSEFTKSS